MRITSAARTAVVRDRQESERVCRMLLQEQRRLEEARCREHSQVSHFSTAALTASPQLTVQAAVDMAARAGREALIAAVTRTEEWCTAQNTDKLAGEFCDSKTEKHCY